MTALSTEQALDFSNKSKRMRIDTDSECSPNEHQTNVPLCLSPPQMPSSTTNHLSSTPPMSTHSLLGLSGLLGPSMLTSSTTSLPGHSNQSAFSTTMPMANSLTTTLQLQQILLGLSQSMGHHGLTAATAPVMPSLPKACNGLLTAGTSLLTASMPAPASNTAELPSAATDPTITAQALQSMQRRRKRAAQMSEKHSNKVQSVSPQLSIQSTVSSKDLQSPSKPVSIMTDNEDNHSCETTPSKHDADGVIKDAAYWERRRKNNSAAKRSRDQRRFKEEQVAQRAAYLEQENLKLRAQVNVLKNETAKLQFMLFNNPMGVAKSSPVGSTADSANSGPADTLSPVLTD